MSDMRIESRVTPNRVTTDGGYRPAWGMRDGAIISAPQALALALEGRVLNCHFGTLTTPLASPATTAITTLRPQAWLRVPDGTLVIPLAVDIVVESTGITTQGEILIGVATSDVGNGTSAAATGAPTSMNTALPFTTACTARQLASADVSADYAQELARFSFAASAVDQKFRYTPAQDLAFSVLRGAATLMVYIGGNAVQFYAQMKFIELSETFGS